MSTPEFDAKSIAEWIPRAEQGDAEALNKLGVAYLNGVGFDANPAEAARLFMLAADQGHIKAQFNLALLWLNGTGVAQDVQRAFDVIRRMADHGFARAQGMLGAAIESGVAGVEPDPERALHWFRLAAEQGDDLGQYCLGTRYESGTGVPMDQEMALYWFQCAAEQGKAEMQHQLGARFDHGFGAPQDTAKALLWYRRAAEQGHAGAQNNLASVLLAEENTEEAVYWFKQAAGNGDSTAKYNLGRLYFQGEKRCARDDRQAIEWIESAAESGTPEAMELLNQVRSLSSFENNEPQESSYWAARAEHRNEASRAYAHALQYLFGDEGTRNYKTAAFWLKWAAKRDHVEAQAQLGHLYAQGLGVDQDKDEAIRWYRLAATYNHAGAKAALRMLGVE